MEGKARLRWASAWQRGLNGSKTKNQPSENGWFLIYFIKSGQGSLSFAPNK